MPMVIVWTGIQAVVENVMVPVQWLLGLLGGCNSGNKLFVGRLD